MSKMVRLDEDVYSALKSRALFEKITLSETVNGLMHTADNHGIIEMRLTSLESKIDELVNRIPINKGSGQPISKKKRPSRDLNPSRSLDRAP